MPAPRITFDFTELPLTQSGAWEPDAWSTNGVGSIAGHLYAPGTGSTHLAMRRVTTLSEDQHAEIEVTAPITSSSPFAGIFVRMQADGSAYLLTYRPLAGSLILYKGDASLNFTQLGLDFAVSIGVSDRVRLSVSGGATPTFTVHYNGVSLGTRTDTSGTSVLRNGNPGVWLFAPQNHIAITEFVYGDAGGSTTLNFNTALDANWENGIGAYGDIGWEGSYAFPWVASTHVAARYETDFGDDQFSEAVQCAIANTGWLGVATRMQSGACDSYVAIVFANGTVTIYKVTGSIGSPSFTTLATTTVTLPAQPFSFWFRSNGNNHTVYINGVQATTASESSFTSGRVGIAFFGDARDCHILKWSGGDSADREQTVYLPTLGTVTTLYAPYHPGPTQTISLPALALTRVHPPRGRITLLGQTSFGETEYPPIDGGLSAPDVWNVPSAAFNIWAVPGGPHGMIALRGHVKPTSGSQHSAMRWDAGLSSDQWAEVVVTAPQWIAVNSGNPFAGPMTRCQSTSDGSCYIVAYQPNGSALKVFRIDDSGGVITSTQIGGEFSISSLKLEDVVGLASVGDEHRVYLNGQYLGSRIDSTYSGGQPGIWMFGNGNELVVTEFRYGTPSEDDHALDGSTIAFDEDLDSDWANGPGSFLTLEWEASCCSTPVVSTGSDIGPPSVQADHHTAQRRHANLDDFQASEGYFMNVEDGSWVGVTTRMQSDTDSGGYCLILFASPFSGNLRIFRTEGGLGTTTFGQGGVVPGAELGIGTVNPISWPLWLKLESNGSTHKAYVDDVLILTVTDNTYHGGQPGFAFISNGGVNSGRLYQWRTWGDQKMTTAPPVASTVILPPRTSDKFTLTLIPSAPLTHVLEMANIIAEFGDSFEHRANMNQAWTRADGTGAVSAYRGRNYFTLRMTSLDATTSARLLWSFYKERAGSLQSFYVYNCPAERSEPDPTGGDPVGRYLVRFAQTRLTLEQFERALATATLELVEVRR